MDINVKLHFERGYIADPYWPAMEKLINIQKTSGMNRVRDQGKRDKALSDYIASMGMTVDDYHQLGEQAARPFYTWADVLLEQNGRQPNEIVVPAHQMYGCLAEASKWVSKAMRLASPEQIRTVLKVTDFSTGKAESDGVWERFVTVKGGAGNTLSNQRGLRSDPYIKDFVAEGRLHFSDNVLDQEKVRRFMVFAGSEIGVGAARKMDWGRFTVRDWATT